MDDAHRYPLNSPPVQACVLGCGGFGVSVMAQARHQQRLDVRVAVDQSAQTAFDAWLSLGVPVDQVARCDSAAQAQAAWQAGLHIAVGDLRHVLDLPMTVLVEATGEPEAGARHAQAALAAGWHVALASKEVDSVVGPQLCRLAQQQGRVVSPVDGDQPALLIGLISWARALGLEIVAAGKASEYDYVLDLAQQTLSSNGVTIPVAGFEQCWQLPEAPRAAHAALQIRSQLCAALPQRIVADLCELQIVANYTGLSVDTPTLHAPILRPSELADWFRPIADGGLFTRAAVLDVFHCLRRPDELSFAGGVFVVVRCQHAPTWAMLHDKGHVLSRDRLHALLYVPRHLLGLEALTSLLEAGVHGRSSGVLTPTPQWDVLARAARALPAGTHLAMGGHHHSIAGLTGELHPARALSDTNAPVPFYLASNRRLRRDVAAGHLLRVADLEPEDPASASVLWSLRAQQDATFFSSGA